MHLFKKKKLLMDFYHFRLYFIMCKFVLQVFGQKLMNWTDEKVMMTALGEDHISFSNVSRMSQYQSVQ